MLTRCFIIVLLFGAIFGGRVFAQEMTVEEYLAALEAELPGTLVNNPVIPEWTVFGDNPQSENFTRQVITDRSVAGEQAIRLNVKRARPNPWDTSMTVTMDRGVAAGDAILIAIWARAEEPLSDQQTGEVQVRLQQAGAPYAGLAESTIFPTDEWELWYVRGVSPADFSANEINLAFNVAAGRQTIDIAQFYVMDLGPGIDVNSLPTGLSSD